MLRLFSAAYPPFPQKQTYSRAATFLWASFTCWHQWIYTTDECGCLCLILVMMAAVRLDHEVGNPIICHPVCPSNRVFVKVVALGEEVCGFALQVSASYSCPAQRCKAFSCIFLQVGPTIPDRKGKKLCRENTLIRKKAASKQSFGFVWGRKLGDFRLTAK